MATYVYETLGEKPERFEIEQSMKDEPLRTHPVTGEPVRRVITGGFAPMGTARGSGSSSSGGGSCCNPGGCGCH